MKIKIFKDTFIFNLISITLVVFFIELLFKAITPDFAIFDVSTIRILISSFLLTFIVTFVSSLCHHKIARNIINVLYMGLYSIYAWLQLAFLNYLGVYMSFNTSSQFGAVKDYIWDFLDSIRFEYYIVFIPMLLFIVIYFVFIRKKIYQKLVLKLKYLIFIPIIILLIVFYLLTITLPFMQNKYQIKSNIKLFKNPDVPTVAVNQFGTTVFGLLDLKSYLLPTNEDEHVITFSSSNESNVKVSREVSPALNYIAGNETNKKYTNLNNYFASQKVTDFNEYTGMFEGKNVVVVLMESASDAMINEEFFPNFYKLYKNGWHWTNNYSPRNSCATGNNEFSAMTGLYSIYNTCTSNVYKNNTYFESIFGLFNDKGYKTSSYHDFAEWYYYRNTIHKNMGSQEYYGAKDLDIKTASYYGEWPSDIEFFEKAFDIILSNHEEKQPFMSFLTTVTSHQPYSNSSTYGNLHRKLFQDRGYSYTTAGYLSKIKVLDDALGVMIQKLTDAGVYDDTVIILLADHYPYGLNKSYVKEIIDYDLSDYDIEKTPFVIYNSKMEAKEFTEYTSYINILPTIANLMNLDYDPRLYMGTDLFSSDYESRVVFADGSWKNENAYYNSSTSRIKYYTEEEVYTPEQIQEINTKVGLQISMSSNAIKNNYFDYLKKKIDEYNLNNVVENDEKNELAPLDIINE